VKKPYSFVRMNMVCFQWKTITCQFFSKAFLASNAMLRMRVMPCLPTYRDSIRMYSSGRLQVKFLKRVFLSFRYSLVRVKSKIRLFVVAWLLDIVNLSNDFIWLFSNPEAGRK
jgi:hypothetical protein